MVNNFVEKVPARGEAEGLLQTDSCPTCLRDLKPADASEPFAEETLKTELNPPNISNKKKHQSSLQNEMLNNVVNYSAL